LSRFDSTKNYYRVLGAAENASRRDIERLYRRLAHQRHPDRGGSEEEMKTLNEAYQILHDDALRSDYDKQRIRPLVSKSTMASAPAAREVGVYGQALNAMLCLAAGAMLLLLVRFNGLWFLWPLGILAVSVMLFGVMLAYSALCVWRESFPASHPARRFRFAQELVFWTVIIGVIYGWYLILTTV
jgi:curved DNA-binding protein CbpA